MPEADDRLPPNLDELAARSAHFYHDGDPAQRDDPESDLAEIPLFAALSRIRQPYENLTLLGRGGMKEVYRAYDAYTARDVALAKPKADLPKAHYDAFLREAHITARLQHPGIINLFNMGVGDDGRPFFTMELKRGCSLRQILSELGRGQQLERYPLRARLVIFLRVCEAIAYAHAQRVVHLDIKPENIQVGEFGEVQVRDWGMGEVLPGKEGESPTDALLDPDLYGAHGECVSGTPAYMSPEQRDPRSARTQAMDTYALGCLLGELVTLQPPDKIGSDGQDTRNVLAAIISKARAEALAERYASVEQLREDVARHVAGYSTSVEPRGVGREAMLFYRRNRAPCLVTFGLLAVLTLATAVFVAQLREKKMQAETSQRAAEDALQRYLATKQESDRRLSAQVAETVYETNTMSRLIFRQLSPNEVHKRAVKQVEAVIANQPLPESRIWNQRFQLYFQAQQFEQALALPLPPGSEDDDLMGLAQIYRTRVNPSGFLATPDLIELIRALSTRRQAMIEHIITLDTQNRRPPGERAGIIEAVLQVINQPKWSGGKLLYTHTKERREAGFSGQGLATLILAKGSKKTGAECVLKSLNLKKLDLRGTAITSLSELLGLELIELDLRATAITELRPLQGMRSLHRLIVAKGQFSAEQLVKVPDFIQVLEN